MCYSSADENQVKLFGRGGEQVGSQRQTLNSAQTPGIRQSCSRLKCLLNTSFLSHHPLFALEHLSQLKDSLNLCSFSSYCRPTVAFSTIRHAAHQGWCRDIAVLNRTQGLLFRHAVKNLKMCLRFRDAAEGCWCFLVDAFCA